MTSPSSPFAVRNQANVGAAQGIPLIGQWVKNRGWYFLTSWLHRGTGILLSVYVFLHVTSLSSLASPDQYNALMSVYRRGFMPFLEWALAIPVMFHALNGARLCLFELYGLRNIRTQMVWTWSIVALFSVIMAVLMVRGDQQVSVFFFWIFTLGGGGVLAAALAIRLFGTGHSVFWTLHRVAGGFLVVAIPAHLVFMHLNPSMAKDAAVVLARMQDNFVKLATSFLMLAVFYHAGYGLTSLVRDYFPTGTVRRVLLIIVIALTTFFAFVGLRLLFAI
jgi:succinate dehydrogenase / fumarate reductase, cytochrome b subunit